MKVEGWGGGGRGGRPISCNTGSEHVKVTSSPCEVWLNICSGPSVVAQLDSMTRGSNQVRSARQICESLSESKCCADSSVFPTPVCVRTHTNVRTLKIM